MVVDDLPGVDTFLGTGVCFTRNEDTIAGYRTRPGPQYHVEGQDLCCPGVPTHRVGTRWVWKWINLIDNLTLV